MRTLLAVTSIAAMFSAACGPEWPSRATTVADMGFMQRARPISTVDVLPIDLVVWTEQGSEDNPDTDRFAAQAAIANALNEGLEKQHYPIVSVLGWDGTAAGGSMMSVDDLLATVAALSHYGEQAAASPGSRPTPYLPARLGETSGADATLYVGGWGYVGVHHTSTGAQVAEYIAIGILVVAAIAVVAAVVAGGHGGGGGGGHGGGGGGGGGHGGGGFVSHGAGHPAAIGGGGGGGHATDGSGIMIHTGQSWRGGEHGGSLGGEHHGDVGRSMERVAGDAVLRTVDAFGRIIVESTDHVDWEAEPNAPHSGDAQMYLEMTLVDNHTGLVLWHAHQKFPAYAGSRGDVERAARTLMATLPRSAAY